MVAHACYSSTPETEEGCHKVSLVGIVKFCCSLGYRVRLCLKKDPQKSTKVRDPTNQGEKGGTDFIVARILTAFVPKGPAACNSSTFSYLSMELGVLQGVRGVLEASLRAIMHLLHRPLDQF